MRGWRLPQRQDAVKRVIVEVDQPRVNVRMRAERYADDATQINASRRVCALPHRNDTAVAHKHTAVLDDVARRVHGHDRAFEQDRE
jgi:hypothetical protein